MVPVYNVEKYLDRCVESLVGQDMDDYEIILVNDASTDDSERIMEKWRLKDGKISCYHKIKNSGLSDTRNYGIHMAKGNYILFVDSDDYIDRNVLDNLKAVILSNGMPDIVYTGYYLEKGDSCQIKYSYLCERNQLLQARLFMKEELRQRSLPIAACFAVYRREHIIRNFLYFKPGAYHEDELWSPQVLYKALNVYVSDLVFYHYAIRQDSITKAADRTKNGLDLLDICEELAAFSGTIEDVELRKLLRNRIAMVYMKAVSIGKLFRKKFKHRVDHTFPIRYAWFIKDRSKGLIFYLSRRLYCMLNSLK